MKKQFILILNNIRSAYNVGSIFRTADGAGVKKIFLCGFTPRPKNFQNQEYRIKNYGKGGKCLNSKFLIHNSNFGASAKIAKTALGAEKAVPWEYHKQISRCLFEIKNQISNIKIVALEQTPNSKNIFKFKPKFPLALIVGNEVRGINKKILSLADKIVEIPMHGEKESLNVAVATGIALYQLMR